jgi:serpin B
LVLVNAIYFKGNWAAQFDPKNTQPRPFHLNNSTTIDVPTMARKGDYNRYNIKELNADIVELPYKVRENT